ncbi:MAG: 3-oxoacid CoA-transferase subunit A [Alphaproteobacteria bacterium]|nr:3-oxoacid CoA-transferase subunit A [Alphaproteobacteria bacterium]
MKKILTISEAGKLIKSDSSVMIGGFLRCGSPARIVDEILKNDIGNLTLIANDTCIPEADRGKLIVNKRIKKAIVAHIGTNPETGRQMDAGEIEVELVPMGTLVERIRAAGAGLGGVLTPTGVGTIVENGKTIMEIEGKKYLFEKPLKADYAIIYATKADKYGNLFLQGTTRNFNTVMATAADVVIVEADELSEEPLNPDEITIPGVFVDYIAI